MRTQYAIKDTLARTICSAKRLTASLLLRHQDSRAASRPWLWLTERDETASGSRRPVEKCRLQTAEGNRAGEFLSMIEGISAVTLGIHEMPRAVRFYRALGFEVLHGDEESSFTSFRAGSSYLNLIAH